MTYLNRSRVTTMDMAECMALLRRHQYGVGRIGLGGDDPVILPVNYLLDQVDIVIQTGDGTIHDAAQAGRKVAFELDSLTHPAVGQVTGGWSVLARGRAEVVGAKADQSYLRLGHLAPAAGGLKPNFVRIVIEVCTGIRL